MNLKNIAATAVALVSLAFIAVPAAHANTPNADQIITADALVNGVTVHYLRAGSGAAVVLVHGYPENSRTWRKIIPTLAQHYTVIAPDTRGTGGSSIAKTMSMREAAEDIHGLVAQLGFRRVFLFGQDFGVPIVSAYAALHRNEVRALVVAESPLSGYGLEALYPKFWHFGFLASPFAQMLVSNNIDRFFRTFAFRGAFVHNAAAFTENDIAAYVDAQKRRGRLNAGFAYYRALLADESFFTSTVPPRWTFPVLALDGDHSMNGLTASSFKRIALNLKAQIVPNSGHFVQEEQPRFVSNAVLSFFASSAAVQSRHAP